MGLGTARVLSSPFFHRRRLSLLTVVLLAAALISGCGVASPPGPSLDDTDGLIHVPLVRQNKSYTCGVAALQSLLYYYGQQFSQDYLEEQLGATPGTGTTATAILDFVHSLGLKMEQESDMSSGSLMRLLDQGIPVMLLIQAWASPGVDYTEDWENGHYVVAIGYDADNIYFMDPATLGHYAFIPMGDFLDRWHISDGNGGQYYHFALVLSQATPMYDWESILLLP